MSGVVAVIILVSLVRFIQESTHILDLSGAFHRVKLNIFVHLIVT
jgi:hypothetical protein